MLVKKGFSSQICSELKLNSSDRFLPFSSRPSLFLSCSLSLSLSQQINSLFLSSSFFFLLILYTFAFVLLTAPEASEAAVERILPPLLSSLLLFLIILLLLLLLLLFLFSQNHHIFHLLRFLLPLFLLLLHAATAIFAATICQWQGVTSLERKRQKSGIRTRQQWQICTLQQLQQHRQRQRRQQFYVGFIGR